MQRLPSPPKSGREGSTGLWRDPDFGGEGLGVRGSRLRVGCWTLVHCCCDHREHSFRVSQRDISRDPDNLVSQLRQKCIAFSVMRLAGFRFMVTAINFDDQLEFDTAEVGGVRRNRYSLRNLSPRQRRFFSICQTVAAQSFWFRR